MTAPATQSNTQASTLCGFSVGDRVKLIGRIEGFIPMTPNESDQFAVVRFSPGETAAIVAAAELAQGELFESRPIQVGDLALWRYNRTVGTVRAILDGLAWITVEYGDRVKHEVVPICDLNRLLPGKIA